VRRLMIRSVILLFFLLAVAADSKAQGVATGPPPPPTAKTIKCKGRAIPQLEDVTEKAGIRFSHTSAPESRYIVESMSGGVLLLDYDRDGWLDIYFTNAPTVDMALKGQSARGALYHNNHDGTFTDVTDKAGIGKPCFAMGGAVGDYDNDGWPDIFLANVTSNQLFHNNGDGTFTDVTAKAGVAGALLDGKKMWSVGAGWFDYNNDGLLDLFVVNYCKWEPNKDPFCRLKDNVRAFCDPKYYAPLHNTLYRNNGD